MVISGAGVQEGTRREINDACDARQAERDAPRLCDAGHQVKVGLLSPRWMDNNPSVTQIGERGIRRNPPAARKPNRLFRLDLQFSQHGGGGLVFSVARCRQGGRGTLKSN
ncbi:hypothetical protein AVEN_258438-1 [Araneus ventricosus]|uniref:Uncharacterized protein n=1 Tax=Araneus ventricosus TaxID=182803 RepID=A0A4Y2DJX1_ARAVE|nr:hypothetical protein AVEN_258438-1 [Araneus ventricosus]